MRSSAGFTLVELMIVLSIMGLLAMIGADQFGNFKDNAERASCISNQRNIVEQSMLYASEARVANAVINVNTILLAGYVTEDITECPESNARDLDDYTVRVVNFQVTRITCDVKGAKHRFDIP